MLIVSTQATSAIAANLPTIQSWPLYISTRSSETFITRCWSILSWILQHKEGSEAGYQLVSHKSWIRKDIYVQRMVILCSSRSCLYNVICSSRRQGLVILLLDHDIPCKRGQGSTRILSCKGVLRSITISPLNNSRQYQKRRPPSNMPPIRPPAMGIPMPPP